MSAVGTPATISGVVAALAASLGNQIVAERSLPAEPASFTELDPPLAPALRSALAANGIERLYSHQAEAIASVRDGRNVLVTTATASGKSLVFQIPVLEEALEDGQGTALFLFPLKALGQDQRAKLVALAAAAGLGDDRFRCEIYDGDTPPGARARIRRRPPNVLITNPDMLHLGILGHHPTWAPFLGALRWIVLDELHVYRGIFGAHFHHVLARLLRIARRHGADPRLIASSATAANAREFAETLAAGPFVEFPRSGSPREARRLLLVQPAASPYTATLDLLVELLKSGQKTIVFTKARRITELLFGWLRRREPELARKVASYRAGFLPEERREIESRLASGDLEGVISTSALELGIDIGGLDACLLVGFPGSMMATWQRSGRVGRGDRESLTALVALPDALDQYLLDHPDRFLARPCEPLIVDPANEPVARAHLECAAAELPLSREGDARYLEAYAPLVGDLLREGVLAEAAEGGALVARRLRPQRDVALRGTGATYLIVERDSGRTIGTIDGARVFGECHPGAIYLHFGRQYEIVELDLERRRAVAVAADVDFFTSPLAEKETEILEVVATREEGSWSSGLGRLRIRERVVGFERKRTQGQEVIDQQALDLPPVESECVGLWWRVPAAMVERLGEAGRDLVGSLHAAEHATIGLFPLLALCDRNDLGGISLGFHPQLGAPGVFVYEGHPGDIGIARRGFDELRDLLGEVRDLVRDCDCEVGCPSCIQSPKCGNGNRPLDKRGAVELLDMLLAERPAASPIRSLPPVVALERAEETAPAAGRERRPRRRARPVDDAPGRSAARALDVAGEAEPGVASQAAHRRSGAAGGTVLFDIETLRSAEEVGGWGNSHRMGIALAVVCHLEEGRFETFPEARTGELAATLKAARLVIGFNSRRFDYAVLAGYTGEDYARTLPTLDLLDTMVERLGRRVSLDHLTRETLGAGKSADGLQSLQWVKEGRFDLIEQYCRRDVELLRDLYLFGRREGYVVVAQKSGRIRVPVDW
ncbi:MAG: DEAD/DEAH box helicase [Thermoanaerobaculia bacterium]